MGLFKPAWMSSNEEKRYRAVEKLYDLTVLVRIARDDPSPRIRALAKSKIPAADLERYGLAPKVAAVKPAPQPDAPKPTPNIELLTALAFGGATGAVQMDAIKELMELGTAFTEDQLVVMMEYPRNTTISTFARDEIGKRGVELSSPRALYALHQSTDDQGLKKRVAQKLLTCSDTDTLLKLAESEFNFGDLAVFGQVVQQLPPQSLPPLISSLANDRRFSAWLDVKRSNERRYNAMVNAIRTALSRINDDDVLISLYRTGSLMTGIRTEPLKYIKDEGRLIELVCSMPGYAANDIIKYGVTVSQEGLQNIAWTFIEKDRHDAHTYELIKSISQHLTDAEQVERLRAAIYVEPSTVPTPFGDDHDKHRG